MSSELSHAKNVSIEPRCPARNLTTSLNSKPVEHAACRLAACTPTGSCVTYSAAREFTRDLCGGGKHGFVQNQATAAAAFVLRVGRFGPFAAGDFTTTSINAFCAST